MPSKKTETAVWDAVEKTDPRFTKSFNKGTYKGTAIDCLYNVKRATQLWGPVGGRWGFHEVEVIRESGCWWTRIRLWYPLGDGDECGSVEAWGGTMYNYTTSKGKQVFDEDAPKKSATDALSKALSLLGFSADIFLGFFDDNKYVAERRKEEGAKAKGEKRKDEENPLIARNRELWKEYRELGELKFPDVVEAALGEKKAKPANLTEHRKLHDWLAAEIKRLNQQAIEDAATEALGDDQPFEGEDGKPPA